MSRLFGCVMLVGVLAGMPALAEDAMEELVGVSRPAASSSSMQPLSAAFAAEAAQAAITARAPPPPITLVVQADLGSQRVVIRENGKAKYTWAISSGRAGFATKTGTFQPQWASRMHYSKQYDLAPMPHAVFFHRGMAFHGTSAVGALGQPASHGCIRLAPGNAATLFKLVHKHGYQQTKIVVQGSRGRNQIADSRGRRLRAEIAGERAGPRDSYRVSRTASRNYAR